MPKTKRFLFRWTFVVLNLAFGLVCLLWCGATVRAQDEESAQGVHTPKAGSVERNGILASLHKEYTTGSGSAVKFQVNYLKVHGDWAWINVVPLDKNGQPEGEEWPSLLHNQNDQWTIIDMVAIARDLDDPVGPLEPSAKFLREIRKRYPGVREDIFPRTAKS